MFSHHPPVALTRHFHDWGQPTLQVALDLLTRPWRDGGHCGPLDLRSTCILVPTRHAGRRLRAGLARAAATHGSAVLAGRILTPEHLIPPPPDAASDALALAVLAKTLLDMHESLPALLPAANVDWNFSFALGLAAQIQDVRRQLADADRAPADLLTIAPAEELDRWRDIHRLEQQHLRSLAALGFQDPVRARRDAASQTAAPSGIRIQALFIPDLPPLAARMLQALSSACDVDIHILAPDTDAHRFDPWGRPLPDLWENEPLPLAESHLHVLEQSPDETDWLATHLRNADRQQQALVACTPDPENARALARRLQIDGIPLFLPNGVPLAHTAPGLLLSAWLGLLRRRDYASTAAFLRHPDAQDWLLRQLDIGDISPLLVALDDTQAKHLPASFQDLLRCARADAPDSLLSRALAALQHEMDSPLPGFLAALYDCRQSAPGAPPDPLFADAAQALSAAIDSATRAAQSLQLDAPGFFDLLTALLSCEQVFPRPGSSAGREATGWLEVQWETSPALLLADMREGIVPENHLADAFLPDGLRARAGIPNNRDALARDLFLARTLIASRPEGGVRFLFSRRSARQEPQLPSRLLMACPDDELPARVDRLFARPALRMRPDEPTPPPSLRLAPPACPPDLIPTSLSITDFKAYLDCPFCFYLSRILRMKSQDDGAREIDPQMFGILVHDTLRVLLDVADLDDEPQIAALLLKRLDTLAGRQFGPSPSLAVRVQMRSLQQRLRAAARAQAESARDGWRIVAAEEKFTGDLDGMALRARIDRIDRHPTLGIRILDYKTTEAGKSPRDTHYRSRLQRWDDLQLPLYRFLYESRHPGSGPISVGYFQLPKAAANTGIDLFDLSPRGENLYASALDAARGVIRNIRAGVFWPPSPRSQNRQNFDRLFTVSPPLIQEPPPP